MLNNSLSENNVFIVSEVNNQIITNFDLEKESDYLKVLNPKLSSLSMDKIEKISKVSLINEIIKKNEIEKVFDLNRDNEFLDDYVKDLYTRLNFNSEDEFKNYLLNSSNYSFEEIEEKIKIELMWNELVYLKYIDQVNINKKKILKKIENLNNEIKNEYKLSEIVFKKEKDINLDDSMNKINSSIIEIGFNNTANIYSISQSAKLGGNIGWIDENNLSDIIYDKVKNLNEGEIAEVVKIGNNFLIIMVDEIRQKNISVNKEDELEKMVKFETNKQLNQYSKIFFDKAKINYSVNDK